MENIEVLKTDRFSCKVINVTILKNSKGVIIEEPFSKSYVYFGKVPFKSNIIIGDTLYIGVKKLNEDNKDKSIKVMLYDENDSILDWTFIY